MEFEIGVDKVDIKEVFKELFTKVPKEHHKELKKMILLLIKTARIIRKR